MADLADVMPLGDSTTYGGIYNGGYRKVFFETRTDLSSTGSLIGVTDAVSLGTDPRWERHEGHSGFSSSMILARVDEWLDAYPARAYIVQIGTANIYYADYDSVTYAANVKAIIDKILSRVIPGRPTPKILLAKIINVASTRGTAAADNAAILTFHSALVAALPAVTYPTVSFVSFPTLPDAGFIADGLHPNNIGYDTYMAPAYLAAATAAGI